MDKMQGFIDFIFFEVWCKATSEKPFSPSLFSSNPELMALMEGFLISDTKSADYFYGGIERIYKTFMDFTPIQVEELRLGYLANNNVAEACANGNTGLIQYKHLSERYPILGKQLRGFFSNLYDFSPAPIRNLIGDMDDHYFKFIEKNKPDSCPFCGVHSIKGIHHSKREAYDHFLPKSIYPFSSMNFKNLVPTCHECNSSYKNQKDPLTDSAGVSRKAFYPFSTSIPSIQVQVSLGDSDGKTLLPKQIEITLEAGAHTEELNTWKDLYGIENRYKAIFCSESGGLYWVEQVMDEMNDGTRTRDQILQTLLRQARNRPYTERNFLKHSFLEGCQKAGLLDPELLRRSSASKAPYGS